MSSFKDQNRQWTAARKAEQRAREEAQKKVREERYQQNLLFKQHGYHWKKVEDVFGPSDDGDRADLVWQLFAPDGRAVTVKEALAAIAAKPAPKPEPKLLDYDGTIDAYRGRNSDGVEFVVTGENIQTARQQHGNLVTLFHPDHWTQNADGAMTFNP